MTGGHRILEAIRRLAETTEVVTGEGLEEVWVGPKAYDALSLVLLKQPFQGEEREDRWQNGLITLHFGLKSDVTVRRHH